ncbi:hypothetical protein RD055328_06490 [Companilactobacillus sp. RD055328]|uniref:DegV family protein n=1 Tax=Companilactobacillus sp. RD055328 TaxID=2916634 RepID=UPI001FC88DE6|nr:DegV family protein [Companilactobacillus sp. RD055328]GKQ42726.1 hypothetical protein RD055328_06490 [Companilactobacillus sp. RD055328]
MAKVYVVTDSSAQLSEEEIKNNNIYIVPLDIVIDGEQYVDGVNITRDEFISKMNSSKQLPTTSQPPLGSYTEIYEKIFADDKDAQILSIHMTESLSGTINAARQAAEIVNKDNITVVDSEYTDWGQTFQVLKAAQLAAEGKAIAEILPILTEIREKTQLHMGVTTIENILKGGRLGRLAGTISTLLNISVVLNLNDGKLEIAKRGRGKKIIDRYLEGVFEYISEHKDNIEMIGLSDCDNKDYCKQIVDRIKEVAPELNVPIRTTSPVISTHTGVGAFALIFYEK